MSLAPIPEPDTTLGDLKLTDQMYSAEALSSALGGVAGKLDSAAAGVPEFSDSVSYAVGTFVSYAGRVYQCTTAHSKAAWDPGHFAEVNLLFSRDYRSANIAVGANAKIIGQWNSRSVAIGPDAASNNEKSIALGDTAVASANSATAIGSGAKVAKDSPNGVAVGKGAEAGTQNSDDTSAATAVGNAAKATAKSSVAIGDGAQATAAAAVQIGYSSTANAVENSLRFRDTVVVGGDGKIPASSLGEGAARILSMTQEQYDALSEYDENTIYVIVNG